MFNIAEKLTRFEPISREKLKLEVKVTTKGPRQTSVALYQGEPFIELSMGGADAPSLLIKLNNGAKVYFQTINHVLRRLGASSVYKEKGELHHPQQANQLDGSVWLEIRL